MNNEWVINDQDLYSNLVCLTGYYSCNLTHSREWRQGINTKGTSPQANVIAWCVQTHNKVTAQHVHDYATGTPYMYIYTKASFLKDNGLLFVYYFYL